MYNIVIVSLLVVLAGCSTSKEKIFKDDMPTMKEVYEEKFNNLYINEKPQIERELEKEGNQSNEPVVSAYEKLHEQFPQAPNPTMLMFIFPHLTQAGTPVPGYNTYFKLYETDHFTLSNSIKE